MSSTQILLLAALTASALAGDANNANPSSSNESDSTKVVNLTKQFSDASKADANCNAVAGNKLKCKDKCPNIGDAIKCAVEENTKAFNADKSPAAKAELKDALLAKIANSGKEADKEVVDAKEDANKRCDQRGTKFVELKKTVDDAANKLKSSGSTEADKADAKQQITKAAGDYDKWHIKNRVLKAKRADIVADQIEKTVAKEGKDSKARVICAKVKIDGSKLDTLRTKAKEINVDSEANTSDALDVVAPGKSNTDQIDGVPINPAKPNCRTKPKCVKPKPAPGGDKPPVKPPVNPGGDKPPVNPGGEKPPVNSPPSGGDKPPVNPGGEKPPVNSPPSGGNPGGEKPPVNAPPSSGDKPPVNPPPSGGEKPPVNAPPSSGDKPPVNPPPSGGEKPPVNAPPPPPHGGEKPPVNAPPPSVDPPKPPTGDAPKPDPSAPVPAPGGFNHVPPPPAKPPGQDAGSGAGEKPPADGNSGSGKAPEGGNSGSGKAPEGSNSGSGGDPAKPGSGSGEKPDGSGSEPGKPGSGEKPDGSGSGEKPDGSGVKPGPDDGHSHGDETTDDEDCEDAPVDSKGSLKKRHGSHDDEDCNPVSDETEDKTEDKTEDEDEDKDEDEKADHDRDPATPSKVPTKRQEAKVSCEVFVPTTAANADLTSVQVAAMLGDLDASVESVDIVGEEDVEIIKAVVVTSAKDTREGVSSAATQVLAAGAVLSAAVARLLW